MPGSYCHYPSPACCQPCSLLRNAALGTGTGTNKAERGRSDLIRSSAKHVIRYVALCCTILHDASQPASKPTPATPGDRQQKSCCLPGGFFFWRKAGLLSSSSENRRRQVSDRPSRSYCNPSLQGRNRAAGQGIRASGSDSRETCAWRAAWRPDAGMLMRASRWGIKYVSDGSGEEKCA